MASLSAKFKSPILGTSRVLRSASNLQAAGAEEDDLRFSSRSTAGLVMSWNCDNGALPIAMLRLRVHAIVYVERRNNGGDLRACASPPYTSLSRQRSCHFE